MSSFLGRALSQALLTRAEHCLDVCFVRHGQQQRYGPEAAESTAYDAPLTATGHAQAAATAEALASFPLTAVWASHLTRAQDTAAAIAGAHRLGVGTDPRLSEVGVFRDVPAGQTFEQAVGAAAAAEAVAGFVRTRRWDALPLGERSAPFRARVHAAIWEIVRGHLSGGGCGAGRRDGSQSAGEAESGCPGADPESDRPAAEPGRDRPAGESGSDHPAGEPEAIAIVCHGGVINAFLAEENGLAADFLFRPAHAGITRVRFSADRAVTVTANEIAHLESRGLLSF